MILLIGGAGETGEVASKLAAAGYAILVSTATDIPITLEINPSIERRTGSLTAESLSALIIERSVRAMVDATHPYAVEITRIAMEAAKEAGLPYFRFERPPTEWSDPEVIVVEGHEEAAVAAAKFRKNILLTTGSKRLAPYVEAAREVGVNVVARTLSDAVSLRACAEAGIESGCVIGGTGPYSTEENIETIRKHDIGVIVTKDSGVRGGTPEKLVAAKETGCRVVMISRPKGIQHNGRAWSDVDRLIAEIQNEIHL